MSLIYKVVYRFNGMEADDIDLNKLEVLNKIFLEAAKNPEFRDRLLSDPKTALSSYDISEDLMEMLVRVIQGQVE